MDTKPLCGTWITEEDENVIRLLRTSPRRLSAEQLAEMAGLPVHRVNQTLKMLQQQSTMRKSRTSFLQED